MECIDCYLKIDSKTPLEFICSAQRVVQLYSNLTGKPHHLYISAYSGDLQFIKYKGILSRKLYKNKDEIQANHKKLASLLKTCNISFQEHKTDYSFESTDKRSIIGREVWGYNSEQIFAPGRDFVIPSNLDDRYHQLCNHPAVVAIKEKIIEYLKDSPNQFANTRGIIVNYGKTKVSVSNNTDFSLSGECPMIPVEKYGSNWNQVFFNSFGMDCMKDDLTLYGFVLASIKQILEEITSNSAQLLLIDKTVATRVDEGCTDVIYRYDMSILFRVDNTAEIRPKLVQW